MTKKKIKLSEYWSEPYYGYTHLGQFGVNKYWATVQGLIPNKITILTKWTPGCGFSPEKVDFRGKGCLES